MREMVLQALLETASSEKLPPLLEHDGSSMWTRPIRRSVTQARHVPGASAAVPEDLNDSIYMRKMVRWPGSPGLELPPPDWHCVTCLTEAH